MSKKTNGVNYGKSVAQKSRRERVIVMLEKQLKVKTKRNKVSQDFDPLTDSDVKRINKELDILKSRV